MKLVVQRVLRASVRVGEEEVGRISKGLLVLFGAEKNDGEDAADFLAEKILNLRIFADDRGKMNFSCKEISGGILAVSQFTLAANCAKGRRPGFDNAAPPQEAEKLYNRFVAVLARSGLPVATGRFGAEMQVELVNDGPVTFILERS